jgi:hypothetical protein
MRRPGTGVASPVCMISPLGGTERSVASIAYAVAATEGRSDVQAQVQRSWAPYPCMEVHCAAGAEALSDE